MEISHLLDSLNLAQRQAVTTQNPHTLVLAGAGSGKTKVLTQRIAWLMEVERVSPYAILAVTFTNKAAGEMRTRIEKMVGGRVSGMWVGTFHGIAHRLLRKHYQSVKLAESFQVIDSDDQYRLIKRVMKLLNLDESRWPAKQVQWFINQQKDAGLRSHAIAVGDYFAQTMQKIYAAYEQACEKSHLIDFAELLFRVDGLWRNHSDILKHYQQRFRYILVDEFQDTNTVQYNWLKQLIAADNAIMAVGDDDQSIYGWRGAKIENIHDFSRDFSQVETIRLEQNYRSTGNILAAANALIKHNNDRLGKDLWTDSGNGELLSVYAAFNEIDEARFLVGQIQAWVAAGNALKDIAILYRSNAQSRVIEEALLQKGVAYQIYGGLRFFERAEIKDALGYLRLIANRDDDAAFERIVNTPARGIGARTLVQLREVANVAQVSMWQAATQLLNDNTFTARASNCLQSFITLIEQLAEAVATLDLPETIEHVIEKSGLLPFYELDKTEKGRTKVENLAELITAAKEFNTYVNEEDDLGLSPLLVFLTHAALEAGDHSDQGSDSVQLMTLHSAKGLEFPFVIMAGMEEGLFPHAMSYDDPERLQEERRLCYVGLTRARQKLLLTYAESRRMRGSETYNRPSRFLQEIPAKFIQELRLKSQITRPLSISEQPILDGYRIGQRVRHPVFGEGFILNCEGNGPHTRVQVNFNGSGQKWLVLSYANLEAL